MKNWISFGLLATMTNLLFAQNAAFTNELIWSTKTFNAEGYSPGPSMKDGLHYTLQKHSELLGDYIVKYAYETGDSVAYLAGSKEIFGNVNTGFSGYQFNEDETMLLVETETEPVYRYSYYARYHLYNLKDKSTTNLRSDSSVKQRLATFSPSGKHIAFVENNNLFVLEISIQKTEQITQNGSWNAIINGATDWVYEEEFGLVQGYQWNHDGTKLAYYIFDESQVNEYSMDTYGTLYPEKVSFKYPKAGEKNSKVSIAVYQLTNHQNQVLRLEDREYIPRIKWTNNPNLLFVLQMNRHQNELLYESIDFSHAEGPVVTTLFKEESKTYIDITDNLYFLPEDKGFVVTSENDGYNHLYLFNLKGQFQRQITKGQWEVMDLYGMDANQNLYFSATENTIGKGIYRVDIKGKNMEPWMGKKYNGGYYDAHFSEGMKYLILTHSTADSPAQITLHNHLAQEVRTLVTNEKLKSVLANYQPVKKEFIQFQTLTGVKLNAWVMKPEGAEKSGKQYPVLVAIYGGPGRNTVLDQYEGKTYLWHQLLVQNGYIVVSVDPRGTQYKGRDFKHATYQNLGKYETEDFIETAKFLGSLPYVNKERINMQGWSFGGYMTSLCMTKGAAYYHAGIAVAPVTHWKYYDSIYTERFLRTPQENQTGYEENSPLNYANQLQGPFLLVHGSADDNVHYQNSMDFAEALIQANKKFEFFTYPNKNHSIYGGKTRLHLFTKMTDFLLENK